MLSLQDPVVFHDVPQVVLLALKYFVPDDQEVLSFPENSEGFEAWGKLNVVERVKFLIGLVYYCFLVENITMFAEQGHWLHFEDVLGAVQVFNQKTEASDFVHSVE